MENNLYKSKFAFAIFMFLWVGLKAQVFNDECVNAQFLGAIQEYCSAPGEFTNVDATDSPVVNPSCWTGANNDVWLSFTPTAPGAFFQVFGKQDINDNNFTRAQLAVYDGPCGSLVELGCVSAAQGVSIAELVVTGLVIGKVYYLRVNSASLITGNFHLCIESFIPSLDPESDCVDAVVLCDKAPIQVQFLTSSGTNVEELNGTCLENPQGPDERGSVWYKWTCDQSGTLSFDLEPNNNPVGEISDDLDFVVFELTNGLDDCLNRTILRCMGSGANGTFNTAGDFIPNPLATWAGCNGATGLSLNDPDIEELPGCQNGNNNYAAALNMVSGRSYALVINNFSETNFGFSIDFGGTGTFLGPQPGFDLSAVGDVIACEKAVLYEDQSIATTDQIINYEWSFGVGADPQLATGIGPHLIEYESFGWKTAALTVTSSRGCTVTELLDIFVEPCCADTSTLSSDAIYQDLFCFNVPEGSINAVPINGAPNYMYSIDGVNFQPNPNFTSLPAGDYDVIVQDIKGCESVTTVTISEPAPVMVDVGDDITLDLGFTADINSFLQNAVGNVSIEWTPTDGLSCTDCLNPTILGGGVSVYTLIVTDANGCTASDQLSVEVDIKRPIYPPTVFSPNGDGVNDFFTIYVGPAVSSFDNLMVYDRWGNLMYEGNNIELNSMMAGWDGTFQDKELNPGYFTWIARISFVDNPTIPLIYTGGVTLMR